MLAMFVLALVAAVACAAIAVCVFVVIAGVRIAQGRAPFQFNRGAS